MENDEHRPSNRPQQQIPRWAQNAAGAIIASLLVALVIGSINARDTIRDLDLTVEHLKSDIETNEARLEICRTNMQVIKEHLAASALTK